MRALAIFLTLTLFSALASAAPLNLNQRTALVEIDLRALFKTRPLPTADIEAAIVAILADPRPALKVTLGNQFWRNREIPGLARVRAIYLYSLGQSRGDTATARSGLLMSAGRGDAGSNGPNALMEQYRAPLAQAANETLDELIREAGGVPLTPEQVGRHAELIESYEASVRHFSQRVVQAQARLAHAPPGSSGATRDRLIKRIQALAIRLQDWQARDRVGGVYRASQKPLPDDLRDEIEAAETDLLVYEAQAQYARAGLSDQEKLRVARSVSLIDGVLFALQALTAMDFGDQMHNDALRVAGFVLMVIGVTQTASSLGDLSFDAPEKDAQFGIVARGAIHALYKLRNGYARTTSERFRASQREEFARALEKEMRHADPATREAAAVMLSEFRKHGSEFSGTTPPRVEIEASAPRLRVAVPSGGSAPLPAHERKRIEVRDEEFLPDEEGVCLRQTLRSLRVPRS